MNKITMCNYYFGQLSFSTNHTWLFVVCFAPRNIGINVLSGTIPASLGSTPLDYLYVWSHGNQQMGLRVRVRVRGRRDRVLAMLNRGLNPEWHTSPAIFGCQHTHYKHLTACKTFLLLDPLFSFQESLPCQHRLLHKSKILPFHFHFPVHSSAPCPRS